MDRVDRDSLEWLRASASMPVVTRPVKVSDGRLMLDGGISDSIPLAYFQSIGYDRNVVVLTQPRDYVKRPVNRLLFSMLLRRWPAIADAMIRRHDMYNAQLAYLDRQAPLGNTLIIAPDSPLPIGRLEMNPDKMKSVYLSGRNACTAALPELTRFLSPNLPKP